MAPNPQSAAKTKARFLFSSTTDAKYYILKYLLGEDGSSREIKRSSSLFESKKSIIREPKENVNQLTNLIKLSDNENLADLFISPSSELKPLAYVDDTERPDTLDDFDIMDCKYSE